MKSHMEEMKKLEQWFSGCPYAVTAFSGGVDSALVAWLARRFLGADASLAVIADSPALKRDDLVLAETFCKSHEIPLQVIPTDELLDQNYVANAANRCYFCKSSLYGALKSMQLPHPGAWILNGTNIDDLGDYRPGLSAADECGIRSPLADCGIGKETVRQLAKAADLEVWDKPATPCLSSRIPYGQEVTREKLQRIELAEALLIEAGFDIVRVRYDQGIARVEVPPERIPALLRLRASLQPDILSLGFTGLEVDLEGFVSGKLNRVLT